MCVTDRAVWVCESGGLPHKILWATQLAYYAQAWCIDLPSTSRWQVN